MFKFEMNGRIPTTSKLQSSLLLAQMVVRLLTESLSRCRWLMQARAAELSQKTGKPARRFKDFVGTTRDSWSRERRVVAKAEWTEGEANPRLS
jgi:hypothetical protein